MRKTFIIFSVILFGFMFNLIRGSVLFSDKDEGTLPGDPYCGFNVYDHPYCRCLNGTVCLALDYPLLCCDNSQWPSNFFQTWVFVSSNDPQQTIDPTKPLVIGYHGGANLT